MDQFGICNKPMLANETDILEIFLDFQKTFRSTYGMKYKNHNFETSFTSVYRF